MMPLDAKARRAAVEERLRALGPPPPPRLPPPPEGRLGIDEQPAGQLREALADLGPVFASFGRYLSSRPDVLTRRACTDLRSTAQAPCRISEANVDALMLRELGEGPDRRFVGFERDPSERTAWWQRHHAWLASGIPVTVTIVRPDADERLEEDLPLLALIAPWLDAPSEWLAPAIEDFASTLRTRLDQSQQAASLVLLCEDAEAGGALDAPRCYLDHSARRILTTERVDGVSLARAIGIDTDQPDGSAVDREAVARQLAAAWLRQSTTGRVVPFDFDLRDLSVRDGRVVMLGGAFEPVSAAGRERLVNYFVAAAADDPDAAWHWIAAAADRGAAGKTEIELRRRLRQVVPFRDGEWSGGDRLAEYLLVQWRATREAGWVMQAHPLHVYRGIHAVATASELIAHQHDTLVAALHRERLRVGLTDAQHLLTSGRFHASLAETARHFIHVPQKIDELLNLVSTGRLRVKADVPDGGERREARNRTVSLVASLVTLVALTFIIRRMSPAYGAPLEWLGAVLVLLVG